MKYLLLCLLLIGCAQSSTYLIDGKIYQDQLMIKDLDLNVSSFNKEYLVGHKEHIAKVIDWDGKVILDANISMHHDADVTNHSIVFLSYDVFDYNNKPVVFDNIIEIDFNGTIIRNWSSYEHIEELQQYHELIELDKKSNNYEPCDASVRRGCKEYYHLNSIQVIPENSMNIKGFEAGNWLISDRTFSLIFIVDKKGSVVWVLNNTYGIDKQHSPRLLDNSNLIIFDNGDMDRNKSRVIEINLTTNEIVWEYTNNNFFARAMGSAQRFGTNTIITNANNGYAFEVDQQNNIVWEYTDTNNEKPALYRVFKIKNK